MESKFTTISIEDGKYKTLTTKKFDNRQKWIRPDERQIFSLIPGTIVKILVKEGDTLNFGDSILTLEAMKMQNYILAPFDGVIKQIHVKEKQRISRNVLMIEFE